LKDDTSNHEIGSKVKKFFIIIGTGGKTSSNGLKEERDEVAANEDPCIKVGRDAGVLLAKVKDDVFECEVDTGSEESGREDEAGDLNGEAGSVPL
jgi:hypothetical protein